MKKEFEKKLKNQRKILKGIGIFEIIGGVTGIGLLIYYSSKGIQTSSYVLLIILFAIGFYTYSIYAGNKLYRLNENGAFHSRILQYLQIIGISFAGVTFILTSGGYLFVGYNFTEGNIDFNASIASRFRMNLLHSPYGNFLYINILPIIIISLLEKSLKGIKNQKLIKENYEQNMKEWMPSKTD